MPWPWPKPAPEPDPDPDPDPGPDPAPSLEFHPDVATLHQPFAAEALVTYLKQTRWLAVLAVLCAACSDGASSTPAKAKAAADTTTSDSAMLADGAGADGSADSTAADAAEDAAADVPLDVPAPEDVPLVPDVPATPPDTITSPDVGQTDTQKLTACLAKNCSEQLGACLGDNDCSSAVGCLAGCNGDTTCMLNCGKGLPKGASDAIGAVGNCAVQQGCVQIIKSGNCGNGKCDFGEQLSCAQDCGTPSTVCGDGKCELTEQLSCDVDCKLASPPVCGDAKCVAPLENAFTCAKDCPAPACGDAKCEPPFETGLTCAKDCPVATPCGDGKCDAPGENVLTCVKDCPVPACGDKNCDLPFESTLTCPLDCGGSACGDAQCSPPLENAFTCAKDCPVPKCGDAKCDAPFETGLTCMADCSKGGGTLGGNLTSCVSTKCGKESLACLGDFLGCGTASFCLGGCKDMSCVDTCGAKLTGGSVGKFKDLRDCVGSKCATP